MEAKEAGIRGLIERCCWSHYKNCRLQCIWSLTHAKSCNSGHLSLICFQFDHFFFLNQPQPQPYLLNNTHFIQTHTYFLCCFLLQTEWNLFRLSPSLPPALAFNTHVPVTLVNPIHHYHPPTRSPHSIAHRNAKGMTQSIEWKTGVGLVRALLNSSFNEWPLRYRDNAEVRFCTMRRGQGSLKTLTEVETRDECLSFCLSLWITVTQIDTTTKHTKGKMLMRIVSHRYLSPLHGTICAVLYFMGHTRATEQEQWVSNTEIIKVH